MPDICRTILVTAVLVSSAAIHAQTSEPQKAETRPKDSVGLVLRNSSAAGQKPENAPKISAEDLEDLEWQGQWVQVQGIVRSYASTPEGPVLRLTGKHATVRIHVAEPEHSTTAWDRLIDSKVVVSGVPTPIFGSGGQKRGTELLVQNYDAIRVIDPAPLNPWDSPLLLIRDISESGRAAYQHRVRIHGTVTIQRPWGAFSVQDPSGGLYVASAIKTKLHTGDEVDVLGYPESRGHGFLLRDAVVRVLGAGRPLLPVDITGKEIDDRFNSLLVQTSGRVLSSELNTLVVQNEHTIFRAQLDGTDLASAMPGIEGSTVRLTGVYWVRYAEDDTPRAVILNLRTSHDILVLNGSPWWKGVRILWVLGILGGVTAGTLVWIGLLRRQVRKHANEICAHAEAEARLQEELHQSRKLEGIGRLAGGIAHDFNNLLMIIMNCTQMLQDRLPGDSCLRRDTERVLQASERAASLIHGLLAFSRKQQLEPKVLYLASFVDETNRLISRLIGEHITIATQHRDQGLRVNFDPGQLAQILINLAANARDAMPDGGVISIQTERLDVVRGTSIAAHVPPGKYAHLSFGDTGVGIPEEIKAHIFEPFFTTKEIGKGTGLGLAIVYGIVKQSGGSIAVDSKVGQGTTFSIYLPLIQSETGPSSGINKGRPLYLPSEPILLVEDEPNLRNAMSEYLTNHGLNVITATNGEHALCVLRESGVKIGLLITDLIMPRMGGRQLAERVMQDCAEIKVIYMSGYAEAEVLSEASYDEKASFLRKPFTLRELLETITAKFSDSVLQNTMVLNRLQIPGNPE